MPLHVSIQPWQHFIILQFINSLQINLRSKYKQQPQTHRHNSIDTFDVVPCCSSIRIGVSSANPHSKGLHKKKTTTQITKMKLRFYYDIKTKDDTTNTYETVFIFYRQMLIISQFLLMEEFKLRNFGTFPCSLALDQSYNSTYDTVFKFCKKKKKNFNCF